MTANLLTRLARLEATQTAPVALETSFSPALRLVRLLLAVYLGDLRPGEDVAAGEARALGFRTAGVMHAAMVAERTAVIGWGSQHNSAVMRMLTPFGGGSASEMLANHEALTALLTTLPETFADHRDADPDQVSAAAEWVSL
ncbi:hypothetical protein [Methylobacterium sp. J-077]|uniref:hypothetical protein n=1 Tax=Methylobacterium sp. J-077 TaxID=2836656 RepID=UPI001FBB625A|nr:hypothetical protein [Methylobacterium sp. J-077]MCJ2121047.1 hypothetical protein [Methylobacterium sp. J-077]